MLRIVTAASLSSAPNGPGPMQPERSPDPVHLVAFRLDQGDPDEAWLDERERERAARMRAEPVRRRFVWGRATLRRFLSAELGLQPAELCLREARHGRPELAGAMDGALVFNMAHSGDRALLAWRRGGLLGVDLEELRPVQRMAELAEETLTPDELEAWRAAPEPTREASFFRSWTRKEAVLKATGLGLSGGLRQLDVRGAAPLDIHFAGARFCVLDLHAWTDCPAALAVDGVAPELRWHEAPG